MELSPARRSSSPGGDPENVAHTHSLPILNDFLVEWNPDYSDDEILLALAHEILHIAFRHVAAAIVVITKTDPLAAAVVKQALEEDTEALARKLVR